MTIQEQINFVHRLRGEADVDEYKGLGFVVQSLSTLYEQDQLKNKKATPDPLHKSFTEAYFVFYQQRFQFKPRFGAAEGKAMKDIVAYLKSITSDALVAWNFVLDNWHKLTPFIANQIATTQINKNINEILSQLKFGTTNNEQRTNQKRSTARDVFTTINRNF